MKRRDFVLLLAGAMTAARSLAAQQKAMPVVGFLGLASPGPFAQVVATFGQGLREAGYIEGQNVAVEYRWAEDYYDRLTALAADLVARQVDVIVTQGGIPPALAQRMPPPRSRSFSCSAPTRSRRALWPASPDRAATSPALPIFTQNSCRSG
jgi:hypothetical protein